MINSLLLIVMQWELVSIFFITVLSQSNTCGTVSLASENFKADSEYVQGVITSVKLLRGTRKQVNHFLYITTIGSFEHRYVISLSCLFTTTRTLHIDRLVMSLCTHTHTDIISKPSRCINSYTSGSFT